MVDLPPAATPVYVSSPRTRPAVSTSTRHQVALFLALEELADQRHRGGQKPTNRSGAHLAALVLVDRLGAAPQRNAERRRNRVRSTACAWVAIQARRGVSPTWDEFALRRLQGVSLLSFGRPYHGSHGSSTPRSVPTGRS